MEENYPVTGGNNKWRHKMDKSLKLMMLLLLSAIVGSVAKWFGTGGDIGQSGPDVSHASAGI